MSMQPERRDPTLVASGMLAMFVMMGSVGALLCLISAKWGYLVMFLLIAGVAGVVLWWVRRPPKKDKFEQLHDGPKFVR